MGHFIILLLLLFIAAWVALMVLSVAIRGKKSLIFFCVLNLILLFYCATLLQANIRFSRRAQSATGQITSFENTARGGQAIGAGKMGSYVSSVTGTYNAVIQFKPEKAATEFVGKLPYAGELKPGQNISILYDPANPAVIAYQDFWLRWEGPLLFLIGTVLLSLLLYLIYKKRIGIQSLRNRFSVKI